ncbi:MAG: hypothetical protein LWW87_15055, partial [Geobacteraceae bacterium]|nr:hypothetical protein [Geobacteraceae bacterium]
DKVPPTPEASIKSDGQGKACLFLYEYELHNRNSKVMQKQLLDTVSVHVTSGSRNLTGKFARQTMLSLKEGHRNTSEQPLYDDVTGERAGVLKIFYADKKVP